MKIAKHFISKRIKIVLTFMDGPKHRSNTSLNCTALQSVSFWPVPIEFHSFECGCGVFSLHLQICVF